MTKPQLPQPEMNLLKKLFDLSVEENKIINCCPVSVADIMGFSYPHMEQMLFKLTDLDLVETSCPPRPEIVDGVETKLFFPIKATSMRITERGIWHLVDGGVIKLQSTGKFLPYVEEYL